MEADYSIRRLNRDDAEAWATLRHEALVLNPLAFGASVPQEREALIEKARERLGPDENAAVFGAYDAQTLIGVVGVRRFDGTKERHKALVWGMFVTESHRGRGAGELLMREAITYARTLRDVEQVRLAVSEVAGSAQRLYSRLGFRAWGVEPRALVFDGVYADEIHMVLDVQSDDA